ncbi:hypothetical protein Droror1_Dr00000049 [Drosera rotundifolia]
MVSEHRRRRSQFSTSSGQLSPLPSPPILTKSPLLLSLFFPLVSLFLPYRHKPPLSRGGAPLTVSQIWFRSSPLHRRPGLVIDLDFTFCKEFLLMVLMICGEVFDVIGVVVA